MTERTIDWIGLALSIIALVAMSMTLLTGGGCNELVLVKVEYAPADSTPAPVELLVEPPVASPTACPTACPTASPTASPDVILEFENEPAD